LFGERRYHARNKSARKTTHHLARQHGLDRAIVGGSIESSGKPFTMEEIDHDAAKPTE